MEEFAVTEGDHITYLNVFNSFEAAGSAADWCEENCLNYRALVRAAEIRQQLARWGSRGDFYCSRYCRGFNCVDRLYCLVHLYAPSKVQW